MILLIKLEPGRSNKKTKKYHLILKIDIPGLQNGFLFIAFINSY